MFATKTREPRNPKGGKPDKLMRDALILSLKREAIDANGLPTKKLYLIADKLVSKALEGDVPAIKEIFDRVDGKSPLLVEADIEVSTRDAIDARLLTPEQRELIREIVEGRLIEGSYAVVGDGEA